MINKVILMGRITKNPELKTTESGISVTSFTLAIDRSHSDGTDFINIVCWRNNAEFVCKHFRKGSLIAVEGELQSRNYTNKDGSTRTINEVVADRVSFTGERV